MPTVEKASVSGRILSQTTTMIPDEPTHQMALSLVSGIHVTDEARWDGARITYWSTSDTVNGEGKQFGYFVNEHTCGGTTTGSYEGKISALGTQVTGTWNITGGTGQYENIVGKGVFAVQMTSDIEIKMIWSGNYELT